MATWYGDTGGEVVAGDFDADGDLEAGAGVVCTVWDSPTGGAQITDLLDTAGNSITQVTASSKGRARFGRPQDNQPAVWVQTPDNERYLFNPRDLSTRIGDGGEVTWDTVSGKPSTYPPSTHTHDDRYFTEAETTTLLAAKAATSHTHDERYYTQTQVDDLVGNATGYTGKYRPAIPVDEVGGVLETLTQAAANAGVDTADLPNQRFEVVLQLGSTKNPFAAPYNYRAGFDRVGKTVPA